MDDISKYTDEQLKMELERREMVRSRPPAPIKNPDFRNVIEYITALVTDKYNGDIINVSLDSKQAVFEYAMVAIYGKTIWHWWNNFRKAPLPKTF